MKNKRITQNTESLETVHTHTHTHTITLLNKVIFLSINKVYNKKIGVLCLYEDTG